MGNLSLRSSTWTHHYTVVSEKVRPRSLEEGQYARLLSCWSLYTMCRGRWGAPLILGCVTSVTRCLVYARCRWDSDSVDSKYALLRAGLTAVWLVRLILIGSSGFSRSIVCTAACSKYICTELSYTHIKLADDLQPSCREHVLALGIHRTFCKCTKAWFLVHVLSFIN